MTFSKFLLLVRDLPSICLTRAASALSTDLAKEAIMFEQSGNMKKALGNWNELFPQVFPTNVDMAAGKTRSTEVKGADALRMMLHHK